MTLSLRQARRLKDKIQAEMAELLKIHVMTYREIEEKPDLQQSNKRKKFLIILE